MLLFTKLLVYVTFQERVIKVLRETPPWSSLEPGVVTPSLNQRPVVLGKRVGIKHFRTLLNVVVYVLRMTSRGLNTL